MASTGIVESFVAAIQASLSVLLVIFYGAVAAYLGLLNGPSTKAISKVCVRLFLPALLFTKIGAELHAGSAHRYVVVLVWAVVCHVVSFVLGITGHLLLGMPDWTTVAIMFNNTTSYPLLLIAALDQTGILRELIQAGSGGNPDTAAAMERAKSYFLVFSTVSSCLTFAVGPRLMDSEHAPEADSESDVHAADIKDDDGPNAAGKPADLKATGGDGDVEVDPELDSDVDEDANEVDAASADLLFDNSDNDDGDPAAAGGPSDGAGSIPRPLSRSSGYDPLSDAPSYHVDGPQAYTETTHLLLPPSGHPRLKTVVQFIDPFSSAAASNGFFPSLRHKDKAKNPSAAGTPGPYGPYGSTSTSENGLLGVPKAGSGAVGAHNRRVSVLPRASWRKLGPRARWWLLFIADFFNAPLLGALAGAVVGLTPALHRAFFAREGSGGIFTAWLTASLDDIGSLFVPLPVVVAGVSLYSAMQEARRKSLSPASAARQHLPRAAVIYILVIRFVLWPLASIATIYALAKSPSSAGLVSDDPMLWFALMLMPTGPPAMKLITLVQVSDADADDETSMAKLLTVRRRSFSLVSPTTPC